MCYDVTERDLLALSQTLRGQLGQTERLGTRLGPKGFSLGLLEGPIPDSTRKALKTAHTTPGTLGQFWPRGYNLNFSFVRLNVSS